MNNRETIADRLAQFRSEWPRHISWRDVRAEEPMASRGPVHGALLCIPATLCTLLLSGLALEFPAALPLPNAIEWARGLSIVALLWVSIGLWIWAAALISIPGDTRRAIAIARFARERGLSYARQGSPPARQGILLAGGRDVPSSRPVRRHDTDPSRPSLFRAGFALWQGTGAAPPSMQIAIANYTGGKNDPKGPLSAFRYMELSLPRMLPHIMIDSRSNGSLRGFLPGTQRLSLEGDFDRYFSLYVPEGYEQDALQLLTPDVMACLVDHGHRWDIEIVDDRLVVVSRRFRRRSDRAEYTAMLFFSEVITQELGRQAAYYSDPRAARPLVGVSAPGRRLRLRSGAWTAGAIAVVVAAMIAFPHVLGWILDH